MGQAVGVQTTVSSSGNIVLTRDSVKKQRITGTLPQLVLLPSVSDIEVGTEYTFYNSSTGLLTVANASNANPMTIASNTVNRITLVDNTGAGVWILG